MYFKKDLLNIDSEAYKQKYNPHNISPVCDTDIDRLIKPKKYFEAIDVLAFIEHERWNAFELANGVLPMKKSLFVELNKNQSKEVINQTTDGNYHLCIASAKGLVEYYHLFKEKGFDGSNVIKYDYDAMTHYLEHESLLKTGQES